MERKDNEVLISKNRNKKYRRRSVGIFLSNVLFVFRNQLGESGVELVRLDGLRKVRVRVRLLLIPANRRLHFHRDGEFLTKR